MKKKLFYIFLVTLFFVSCKSNKIPEEPEVVDVIETSEEKTVLIKHPDSMMWEIDGITQNGEKFKVYILGTYHAADDRIYPVPESVKKAWDSADTIVCELSTEDWKNFQRKVDEKVAASVIVGTDKSLVDELSIKELMLVADLVGEEQTASAICYEPWVLNSILSNIFMNAAGLYFEKSYDSYFINLAAEENRIMEGLDDLQTQIDLNGYGDWKAQLSFLHEEIASFADLENSIKECLEFYDAYLSNDSELFGKLYFDDIKKSIEENKFYEEYINLLLAERNKKWAEKISDYMNKSQCTFIFAGCAHFVGENSVFEILRNMGVL